MKYEFHAGDYVETKDGQIGYISTFIHNFDGGNTIFVNYRDGRTQGYKFYKDELLRYFNRIGQYDFTKKDEGKIEPLSNNYTESFPIFKTQDTITGKIYKQECYGIDIGTVGKKINELVEAVNRLAEKVNN